MVNTFISPTDPRWSDALLRLEHDVYDLPEYVDICSKYELAKPVCFYACDGEQYCLIPLLLRRLPEHLGAPDGWFDASSPYGYSSALFRGDARWCSKVAEAFAEVCRENNIVSVFVRLNPLLTIPKDALIRTGRQVFHGRTVGVDLTLPQEEIRKQMRRNHRQDISRLRSDNFTVTFDDWSTYDQFMLIYEETMDRVHADPYYHFGREYFIHLKRALGRHLHLQSVIAPDGTIIDARLLTEVNGIVQCHLGGTATAYLSLAPAKLSIDASVWWAKQRGNRVLHIGGGVGGAEDDLFRFKKGFSNCTFGFETWRIVPDEKKYTHVVGLIAGTALIPGSFFPQYRAAA